MGGQRSGDTKPGGNQPMAFEYNPAGQRVLFGSGMAEGCRAAELECLGGA